MANNDFCFMRRGKQIALLHPEESHLLDPVTYYGAGKKRALLLLHGFSSTPAVYRYLIPRIHHYDALVCPALMGHARTIKAFAASTARDWQASATEACEALVKEYEQVDVLGLSLGGLLACELSQRFTLNHLFLLAPALKLPINIKLIIGLAKVLKKTGVSQLRNKGGNIISDEHAEITYRRLPINALIEILSLVKNYHWVAPACSIDLFLGAKDEVIASKEVEQLFLPLPNTKIHWLNNSAHILPLDHDLDTIVEAINSYTVSDR